MLFESTDLAERAKAAGAEMTLTIYPRMWHVWPMYSECCGSQKEGEGDGRRSRVLCEAEDAIEEIADWCSLHSVAAAARV